MLSLSQAIRRLGRPALRLPSFTAASTAAVVRRARLADFSPDQITFLTYGRAVDTTRMRTEFGFEPGTRPRRAFDDFRSSLGARAPSPPASRLLSAGWERCVADADVIPIGSGGRPGRGSGRRTTPSAAARALAGPGAAAARSKKAARAAEKAAGDQSAGPGSNAEVADPVVDLPSDTGYRRPVGLDFAGLERWSRQLFGAGRRAARSPSCWRSCAAG